MGFLKSLRIVIKCKGLPAQLPAPYINCSDIMCLTANVTSKDQHIIVNERELIIFAEFPLSLKISPGEGFHLTEYSVCFFYHLPLFLYIHHRIDLIICSFCFIFHFIYFFFFFFFFFLLSLYFSVHSSQNLLYYFLVFFYYSFHIPLVFLDFTNSPGQ